MYASLTFCSIILIMSYVIIVKCLKLCASLYCIQMLEVVIQQNFTTFQKIYIFFICSVLCLPCQLPTYSIKLLKSLCKSIYFCFILSEFLLKKKCFFFNCVSFTFYTILLKRIKPMCHKKKVQK